MIRQGKRHPLKNKNRRMSCQWQFHLLCSSQSSSSLSFVHNTVSFPFPFIQTVKATTFSFPHSLNSLKSPSRSNLCVASATLGRETQNPSAESSGDQSQELKEGNLSRSYVWVNPNSPRSSQLKQQSYDARYSFLFGLAESLNSCGSAEGEVFGILGGLGDRIVEQDVVVLLNNMSNAENAVIALRFFQQRMKIRKEVILYNVTMKVFRKCKDLDKAEKLFFDMIDRGVRPDNVTFSTIISCARLCSLPSKAVEWFEKMPEFECRPDDVTYSAMIDVYGRAGNVDMALSLYDRARTEKWRLDVVTFSTLIKIYGQARNFDGCLNVFEEMKALGVKPNLVIFNTLLDAMGRARRPWQAKILHKELINSGFSPNWATYAALLRAYGKARYGEDALSVYWEMKERGMELNVVLFNTLLAMCADLGLEEEAVELFNEVKNSRKCQPDSWTFSSMITVYSCHGKVPEAEATLNEMIDAGFEPNIYVFTSLIQCYGKAQCADNAVSAFNRLIELGISPDERFCGCLLNVMTHIPKQDLEKIICCIEKANPKLGNVIRHLMKEGNGESKFKEEALELIKSVGPDVKKAYCNCLIDLCVNIELLERACELLDLGLKLEIYTDLQSRSETQWSLHVKSLSLGAALTSLHVWINDLKKAMEAGEELPPLLGINTGHGKHRYSDKGLATVFESHLKELSAPFHEAPDKVGWFLTTKVAATSWLKSGTSLD